MAKRDQPSAQVARLSRSSPTGNTPATLAPTSGQWTGSETKRGIDSHATGRSRHLRTSGQLPIWACKMKGGISMTLTTHVRVVEPTAVKPIFDYARRLRGAETAAFEQRKHWALNNL